MSLTANISLIATGRHTKPLDLGTAILPWAVSKVLEVEDGTGAGQADRVFTDERTLAPSATEDLDLAGGLTDAFGATITFAKVKAIIFTTPAANVNNVNLTRPASSGVPLFLAAEDGVGIPPNGLWAFAWSGPGISVAAGTGDLITLTNSGSGTSVTCKIVIIGTSA